VVGNSVSGISGISNTISKTKKLISKMQKLRTGMKSVILTQVTVAEWKCQRHQS